jgi:hypothetical protein
MEATIKKLFNEKNQEIGMIVTAKIKPSTDVLHRCLFENELHAFIATQLYQNYRKEQLNYYMEIHDDVPSIVVIRNIDDLPYEEERINFKK